MMGNVQSVPEKIGIDIAFAVGRGAGLAAGFVGMAIYLHDVSNATQATRFDTRTAWSFSLQGTFAICNS